MSKEFAFAKVVDPLYTNPLLIASFYLSRKEAGKENIRKKMINYYIEK